MQITFACNNFQTHCSELFCWH